MSGRQNLLELGTGRGMENIRNQFLQGILLLFPECFR